MSPVFADRNFAAQEDMRTVAQYPDQHGRLWEVTVDTSPRAKLAWVSPPLPMFQAPLIPPASVLKPDPRHALRVWIDYDAWLADNQSARAAREAAIRRIIEEHFKGGDLEALAKRPPQVVLDTVGIEAMPEEFIRAARTGKSAWVLGFSATVPKWAEPLMARLRPADRVTAEELAEDDEQFADELPQPRDAAPVAPEDRDFVDLDEVFDPLALGGTRENLSRGHRGATANDQHTSDRRSGQE